MVVFNKLLKLSLKAWTNGKIKKELRDGHQPPTFALPSDRFCAIDLSCRACAACVHQWEGKEGVDGRTVGDRRARAALAVVAAFVGAGQVQVFAQGVEQGGAGVDCEGLRFAVHLQGNLTHGRLLQTGRAGHEADKGGHGERRRGYGAEDHEVASGNRHGSLPCPPAGGRIANGQNGLAGLHARPGRGVTAEEGKGF